MARIEHMRGLEHHTITIHMEIAVGYFMISLDAYGVEEKDLLHLEQRVLVP